MADAVSVAGGTPAATDAFAQAHHALLADKSLQFKFDADATPPPPPASSGSLDWVEGLAKFLEAMAPLLKLIFWGGLIILGALIVWMIARAVIERVQKHVKKTKPEALPDIPQKVEFRPQRERASALLAEADRLAREGRFSEAVRILLHRTIEDMERALSLNFGDALTAREIEQQTPLSDQSRSAFSKIARAVETSLFGGRPIDGDRFAECRAAYETFAFGRTGR